jgi:hypothetical protein
VLPAANVSVLTEDEKGCSDDEISIEVMTSVARDAAALCFLQSATERARLTDLASAQPCAPNVDGHFSAFSDHVPAVHAWAGLLWLVGVLEEEATSHRRLGLVEVVHEYGAKPPIQAITDCVLPCARRQDRGAMRGEPVCALGALEAN